MVRHYRYKKVNASMWRKLSPPTIPFHILKQVVHKIERFEWEAGRSTAALEKRLAAILDVPEEWVMATDSCTTALAVAQHFLGGSDLWRVCPLTYASTFLQLENEGVQIEWVDCDDEGWPTDPVDVGVELWGRPFPDACLPVTVLDCAHRVLDPRHAELLKRHKETDGAAGAGAVCYSFNVQKEIPALRGGAVISPYLTEEWRRWISCGTSERQYAGGGGRKGTMPDPIGKWILEGTRRLDALRKSRLRVLSDYEDFLGELLVTKAGDASGHLAVIRLPNEGAALLLKHRLTNWNVEHSVHYPISDALAEVTPNAYALSKRIVSVPCHVAMQKNDVYRVSKIVLTA